MRSPFRLLVCAALATATGCGTEASSDYASQPAPATSEFPDAAGRSAEELLADSTITNEIVVQPAGMTYEKGVNRFSFGVFNVDRSQIDDAEVAIYASAGANGEALGPFPARIETLATDAPYASQTTASDPLAATVAYVSEIKFDRPGEWRLMAMINGDDGTVVSRLPSVKVGPYPAIPDVGERPPRIHTPTADDVSDLAEIDTRTPHDTMHEVDFYDVLGQKPTVLLFSTPALCMSRVCGPMVDIEEQVKAELGGEAAFIHQEVFVDNDANKGPRPQLEAFGLETEPWLFVFDDSGRITTRIEGAFSVEDLRAAVQDAID